MPVNTQPVASHEISGITKLMSVLGALTAALIAVTIPTMYYNISIAEIKQSHAIEAAFFAIHIEENIQDRPDLWQYETERLKEVISRHSSDLKVDEREVHNAAGKLVVNNDVTESAPLISVSAPFYDSGRFAGTFTIKVTILPLLIRTVLLAVFSSLLGGFIYYVFRAYPLKKLKKTLIDLQRERDKYDKTLYAIIDGVITVNHQGKIVLINRAAAQLIGIDASKAIGRPLEEVYLVRRSQGNRAGTGEERIFLTGWGGNEFAVEEIRSQLTGSEDDGEGFVLVFRDISMRLQAEAEKLELEQQLQKAQKLESLGVLAGGIAHDFNNILAVIICNCSLALQRPDMVGELIPEIETAAERAAALCRQMLAYAGKTQFVELQVNMTAVVDDILVLLKSTLPSNVTIKPYLSGDLPKITGDAGQLKQIVMDLMVNASEAIGEEQGEITVSLNKTIIAAGQQENDHLGNSIPPGRYLCLKVADTGCGMDEETQHRIFEPFYTTKFFGRGLGLSAMLGIVSSHKGALQLSSSPGRGTTVKVYLPFQGSDDTVEQLQQPAPVPWRGSGTILLAEDEPQLLEVAKALINALGFNVLEASNGVEALELYRKNTKEIALVFTDIGMPLMGGYELIRELKKLDPELPVIISSGFGDDAITSKIDPKEIAGLISKPYNFDQLRDVLKRVIVGAGD